MSRQRERPLRPTDESIVTVAFPLQGEWRAVHTPAHRVPSHGTELWAQRYAFDLWRTLPDRVSAFHRRSALRYWTLGVSLDDCPGYGAPVLAAFDGTVVRASDGVPDRCRLQPLADLARVVRNGITFDAGREPWSMTGNHVVLRNDHLDDCYALYAHLQRGSVQVVAGDQVRSGQHLGAVGHTGNSTAPHLHFQLMTDPDPRRAEPIPCAFAAYERHGHDSWAAVTTGVPARNERIRSRA
jgi:hypothetical protein